MEFTEDFKKIIKDEFDKEDWKELQENLSSLSMAWDERWEDFEFPQFFQEMWEFVDDLLGDLPPRIIEDQHICNNVLSNNYIIYLNRDEWYLKNDNNTNRIEIEYCPWCGTKL